MRLPQIRIQRNRLLTWSHCNRVDSILYDGEVPVIDSPQDVAHRSSDHPVVTLTVYPTIVSVALLFAGNGLAVVLKLSIAPPVSLAGVSESHEIAGVQPQPVWCRYLK